MTVVSGPFIPPHPKHTNSAIIHGQIPFVTNQELIEKDFCIPGECKTRFTKAGRKTWEVFLPDSLQPAQFHMVRKRPPSSQLHPGERRSWSSAPSFLKGLLTQRTGFCLVCLEPWWVWDSLAGPGEWKQQLGLVDALAPHPFLVQKSRQKPHLPVSPWGGLVEAPKSLARLSGEGFLYKWRLKSELLCPAHGHQQRVKENEESGKGLPNKKTRWVSRNQI